MPLASWRTAVILGIGAILLTTTAYADGTYTLRRSDGTTEQVNCGFHDTTVENVGNVAWDPVCVEISSGDVVTWVGISGRHDPGSELDNTRNGGLPLENDDGCFRMMESETHESGLTIGTTFTVRFTYDSAGVAASYKFILNNTTFWSEPRPCELATDLSQSTLTTAVIPYRCFIHDVMQGLIVVHKLGGVG